jgi:hypothetical protein
MRAAQPTMNFRMSRNSKPPPKAKPIPREEVDAPSSEEPTRPRATSEMTDAPSKWATPKIKPSRLMAAAKVLAAPPPGPIRRTTIEVDVSWLEFEEDEASTVARDRPPELTPAQKAKGEPASRRPPSRGNK